MDIMGIHNCYCYCVFTPRECLVPGVGGCEPRVLCMGQFRVMVHYFKVYVGSFLGVLGFCGACRPSPFL